MLVTSCSVFISTASSNTELHCPLLSPWNAGQHATQASAKYGGLGAWFRAGKGGQSEAIGPIS